MILCILFKSLLLAVISTTLDAVPIINVPAKKVSPQGTSLTREMNGFPLIRYSMVYTHTSWSLRKSPLPQSALQAIFPMKYGPMALSLAFGP